jgi:DNA repair exonuclease SbcCD nuclease subunit
MEKERFTDAEIAYILSVRDNAGLQWSELAEKYNAKFQRDRSAECIKKAYHRYRELATNDAYYLKRMKEIERQKKANSLNSKENKLLINEWMRREDIVEAVQGAAKVISKITKLPKPPKASKNKSPMTLELLISDVHVGKKTETFNHNVLQRRLKQVSETVLKEIARAQVHYNVERIVIAFMGDLIESYTMHNLESAKGCEFGNSRQVQEALSQLFNLILLPIAATGIKIDCVGVTGNHDRTEEKRTYNNPGEENITWIIYKTMEEFCKLKGLKNVTWDIPREAYTTLNIYGETVLYEHYDNVNGGNKIQGIESLKAKRTNQLDKPIHFMRGGHFHEPLEFGIGKIIVNGSVPGDDGYSTTLGFRCEPSQTLNFYIKRSKEDSIKRITSFYKRFLIQLD